MFPLFCVWGVHVLSVCWRAMCVCVDVGGGSMTMCLADRVCTCICVILLQEGKYLTVGKSERAKDSGQQLLADMAIQTNAR
jgi:hypothetical protein